MVLEGFNRVEGGVGERVGAGGAGERASLPRVLPLGLHGEDTIP